MIEARNLTKVYRIARPKEGRFAAVRALFHSEYTEKRAVDGIDFTIEDGEVVGYIGPSVILFMSHLSRISFSSFCADEFVSVFLVVALTSYPSS